MTTEGTTRWILMGLLFAGCTDPNLNPSTEGSSGSTSSDASGDGSTPDGSSSSSEEGSTALDGDSSTGPATDSSTGGEAEYCDEAHAEAEAIVDGFMRAEGLVGLTMSLEVGGCEARQYAWGQADIDAGEALTPEHVLRTASITKSYTAALMLKAAEDELLTLDDSLMDWGLDVPDASLITIRQLLQHTSGLSDYQFNPAWIDVIIADPQYEWTPQELIDYTVELPPVGAPGEGYAYSNANFVLAGMIAEQATGQSYAEALRERVLEPNGLAHTYLDGDERWADPTAVGYLVLGADAPQDVTGQYHPSTVWAAGAVASTADDTRAWMATLLASDFLSPQSQQELVDFVPTMIPFIEQYGMGIFQAQTDDATAYGHNGAVLGFQSTSLYDPGSGSSVAVLTNQLTVDMTGAPALDPTTVGMDVLGAVAAFAP